MVRGLGFRAYRVWGLGFKASGLGLVEFPKGFRTLPGYVCFGLCHTWESSKVAAASLSLQFPKGPCAKKLGTLDLSILLYRCWPRI